MGTIYLGLPERRTQQTGRTKTQQYNVSRFLLSRLHCSEVRRRVLYNDPMSNHTGGRWGSWQGMSRRRREVYGTVISPCSCWRGLHWYPPIQVHWEGHMLQGWTATCNSGRRTMRIFRPLRGEGVNRLHTTCLSEIWKYRVKILAYFILRKVKTTFTPELG